MEAPIPRMIAPLFLYVVMGWALQVSRGQYQDGALIAVVLGWTVSLFMIFFPRIFSRWRFSWTGVRVLIWLVLVYFGYKLLRDDMVHYVYFKPGQRMMRLFLWISFLLSVVGLFLVVIRKLRFLLPVTILVGACLFLAKAFVLKASPSPWIDVFTTCTAGSRYFLHGLNPYAQHYRDIYHGAYDYKPGYAYWPGVLLAETPFWAIFGDIRATFIFADFVTVLSILSILRSLRWPKDVAWVAPLLWLAFPVCLFVLEQAWIDTLLIAASSVFIAAVLKKKWVLAGVALGFFCATKQYAVFYAILAGVLLLTPRYLAERAIVKVVAAAVATFSVILVPFALWDWESFFSATIREPLVQGMRTDALTLVAALQRTTGIVLSGSTMSAIYLLGLVVAVIYLWRRMGPGNFPAKVQDLAPDLQPWTAGLILTYGLTFLFGKQAFCNYYYLLAYFVLMHLVLAIPEPVST